MSRRRPKVIYSQRPCNCSDGRILPCNPRQRLKKFKRDNYAFYENYEEIINQKHALDCERCTEDGWGDSQIIGLT